MMQEPITLVLYDENNEVAKTLEVKIIPWGMLKKALGLSNSMSGESFGNETVDAISQFICDLFHGKVTVEELDSGADMLDMISVVKSILSYAGELNPNA